MTIQKHTLHGGFSLARMFRSPAWLVSILISGIGILAYLTALRTLPLSTVQPVLSAYLVIPVLAGAFIFKERIGGKQWLAVGLLIAGVMLLSF